MEIDKNIILNHFTQVSFKKKDYLLEAGKVENFVYFIEEGIVRMFYYDAERNKENTFDFIFSGEFSCSYESFRKRKPSLIYVEALTMVNAFKISRNELESFTNDNSEYLSLIIKILEELFIQKINREIVLLKDPPEKIYLDLLKKEPYLIRTVPLKYLASYIGITSQALSRIRKRIF